MRHNEESRRLRRHIWKVRSAIRDMEEFMDTIKDYEVWNEAARHLAELIGWLRHNEELYATRRNNG